MNRELEQIVAEVNKVVKGKDRVIRKALAAILAGGHVLLEDIPGVGKTTLAMAMGRAMELSCKRMQFTPDASAYPRACRGRLPSPSCRFRRRNK